MTVRIGVVGAGVMGSAHARMLRADVPGARVAQVYDADAARAAALADRVGADVATQVDALIEACDAVVVASPDSTHLALVERCLAVGTPVLCEKPLAVTAEESGRLVEQELTLGRRLVQVGFMRRYDPALVALAAAVRDDELGTVRLVHCVHRNATSTTSTTSANLITGSMVHELDQVRWLLGDELDSIEVRTPVDEGFADPQVAIVRMRSGALVTVEVFVNAGYGYDVRCEVVGTRGTADTGQPQPLRVRRDGLESTAVPADFVVRFAEAYRLELRDWVASAAAGTAAGASTWDGHLANLAVAAGVEALSTGARVPVPRPATPDLYL